MKNLKCYWIRNHVGPCTVRTANGMEAEITFGKTPDGVIPRRFVSQFERDNNGNVKVWLLTPYSVDILKKSKQREDRHFWIDPELIEECPL